MIDKFQTSIQLSRGVAAQLSLQLRGDRDRIRDHIQGRLVERRQLLQALCDAQKVVAESSVAGPSDSSS